MIQWAELGMLDNRKVMWSLQLARLSNLDSVSMYHLYSVDLGCKQKLVDINISLDLWGDDSKWEQKQSSYSRNAMRVLLLKSLLLFLEPICTLIACFRSISLPQSQYRPITQDQETGWCLHLPVSSCCFWLKKWLLCSCLWFSFIKETTQPGVSVSKTLASLILHFCH